MPPDTFDITWNLVLFFLYLALQFAFLKLGRPPQFLLDEISSTTFLQFFSGEKYLTASFYIFCPLFLAIIIYGLLKIIF